MYIRWKLQNITYIKSLKHLYPIEEIRKPQFIECNEKGPRTVARFGSESSILLDSLGNMPVLLKTETKK